MEDIFEACNRAKTYSDGKISLLRGCLDNFECKDDAIITFGSYARREASSESDIDYVIVTENSSAFSRDKADAIQKCIRSIVPIEPSRGGAFGKVVSRSEILANIGGNLDSNEALTRRLLLLLEGEWLCNPSSFADLRTELIERYVASTPKDHQLALFLLNDIIRYWRTMTVDYMYKISEENKPWAVRNIKLVFSRKLMYAGGLFSVGLTADRGTAEKVETLKTLFNLPVIERMDFICGAEHMARAMRSYNFFLDHLDKKEVRDELATIDRSDHSNALFRNLKNEAHRFTRELLTVFEGTFHGTHPIHRAIVF